VSNKHIWFNSLNSGGLSNIDVNTPLFAFDKIQRNDTDVEITTIQAGNLTYAWEVRDTTDNSLLDSSILKSPTFSGLPLGFHDLVVTITSATDTYKRRWRRAWFMWYPKFTEGEADQVIDLSAGNFFQNFNSVDKSGWKIYVKGSGTMQFNIYNLTGSAGYANYVRIQKETGNSDITITGASAVSHPVYMAGATKYVMFDGYNDDATSGWNVAGHATTDTQTIFVGEGLFTNVQFMGMATTCATTVSAATFSFIPPVPDITNNASTYVAEDMVIYDCSITDSGDEAIYIGYNNDDLQGGYRPFKMRNTVIAWNTINGAGRDGIQPGSCVGLEVHNNIIDSVGEQADASHESFISWNGGNSGRCFENIGTNGNMFLNIQSGYAPWDIEDGETTPQPAYFFSNVFSNGTYAGTAEPFAIYCQTQNTGGDTANWPVYIFNNTFKTDKKGMEFFFHSGSFVSTDFKLVNNLFVKVGAAGDYDEVNFTGAGTQPTGELINNLVYDDGSEAPILFTDYDNDDLTISSLSSTVYSTATESVEYIIPALDPNYYDYEGFPLLAGDDYTYGAYSGYNKKTIDPAGTGEAPTLISATIESAAPTNVVMVFSRRVVGTNLGWTIGGTTETAFASVSGYGTYTLTGILATAAAEGESVTLAYSSSTGDIEDLFQTALATFGATAVTNNRDNGPSDIVWTETQNTTATGNTVVADASTAIALSGPNGGIIPASSDGYFTFEWDEDSRNTGVTLHIGIIEVGAAVNQTNMLYWPILIDSNQTIDIIEGDTYKTTLSNVQVDGISRFQITYRIRIDRGTNKAYFEYNIDGAGYVTGHTYSGTLPSVALSLCLFTTVVGKKIVDAIVQADEGIA
jgi:hypothetical protein